MLYWEQILCRAAMMCSMVPGCYIVLVVASGSTSAKALSSFGAKLTVEFAALMPVYHIDGPASTTPFF